MLPNGNPEDKLFSSITRIVKDEWTEPHIALPIVPSQEVLSAGGGPVLSEEDDYDENLILTRDHWGPRATDAHANESLRVRAITG